MMVKYDNTGNDKRAHTKIDPGKSMVYQIKIEGHLDNQWTDWFSGLTITLEENGHTLLTGPVADQAALFGLLKKIRDLGLPLVSIGQIDSVKSNIEKRRNKMNEKMQISIDPDGKWIYRIGGIAAFILVIGYFLTFPAYALLGFYPTGDEERLVYFAQHATGWWVIAGLMVFTDLLIVPTFLALYQVLKGINRNAMLLAIACEGLFIAVDLAVTWTAHSSLLALGSNYAAATSDIQRATFVAAAGYPSTMLDSPLGGIYAILIPALGILLTAPVMSKGIFSKSTVYLGWAVGISGIVAGMSPFFPEALSAMPIINALLVMVWYLFVGLRLYKLSRQTN